MTTLKPLRAHVFSDTHFEHMEKENVDEFFLELDLLNKRDPADLLILAGDYCQIARHEAAYKSILARIASYYKKVLVIAGNHESSGGSIARTDKYLDALSGDPNLANVQVLRNEKTEYKGRTFFGGVLWYPDCEDLYKKESFYDYRVISDAEPAIYEQHELFIKNVLMKLEPGCIVISHHLPLEKSIHAKWRRSNANNFFCYDVNAYLKEETLPNLWVHGHTHEKFDYQYKVGSNTMRVKCNPFGYIGEGCNNKFWDHCGIDL